MAKLNINLRPGVYILTAMHPDALMYGSNITVLSTILANDVVKFFRMVLSIVLSFWMVVAVLWLMPVLL